jgi:hypothetical protein
MSYLKDREIWLSSVPTGNPPAGYFWKFIQNGKVVVRDSSGNNQMMIATSGSQAITGSLTVTEGITGTVSSASYVEYSNVANKPTLVSGSEQITYSNLTGIPSGIVSGSSQVTFLGLSSIPSGIVSGSGQVDQFGYATTGSNGFNGSQSITGSLTVTGQVVAQTLNVQQVTSSIVYSSGSNIFGNSLGNTQQFTGSVSVTGSLTITGPMVGSSIFCSPVGNFSNCLTFADWTTAENVLTSNKPNEQGAYIRAAVSNALNPTYAFENDRDTGVYRDGENSLGFATSGSARMTISSTGDSLFNGTIVVQGACSSRICLIKDYSGTPSNTGFLITDTNGIITFNHNANGAGTNIGGVTCIGSNLCVAGNGYFAGNVGIGCTSPTFHLEVRCAASTSSCYLAAMFSRSTGANDGVGDIVAFGANGDSAIAGIFRTVGSWGLELQTAGRNTRMRIDNSGITTFCCQVCAPVGIFTGCVGIGTTSAGQKLTVDGLRGQPATSGTTQNGLFRISTLSGGYGETLDMGFHVGIDGPPSYGWIQSTNQGSLGINYNIALNPNGGNVGVNTTSPNPSSPLHVRMCSNSNGDGIRIQAICSGASGSQPGIAFANVSDSKRWSISLDNFNDILQITNVSGINALEITQCRVTTFNGTSSVTLPVGTTPQRPTPTTGMVRFNSSCTEMEYYNGSEWLFFTSTPTTQGYYADVLVVGGGGGGGGAEASNGFGGGGAGGGAGGFMAGRIFINYALQSYSIFIGGGGTGGSNESQGTGSGCNGTTGTASCALGLVAIGGGFGGGDETGTGGGNGGSGGGTGGDNSGLAGIGLLGQGCGGGANGERNGGGGGGASTTGFQGYFANNNGGNGRTWLNGTTYAGGGGGGGGAGTTFQPLGGSGGGGNGSSTNATSEAFAAGGTATAGCANTGGGGGAGAAGRAQGGQNGGSGIVIIRYFGSQKGFGGSITSSGGYTYHTFTTSGTYCATYYA